MPKVHPTVHALRTLEKKVRNQQVNKLEPGGMNRPVPGDLASTGFRGMTLGADQVQAFDRALEQLADDQRFEWLKPENAEEALWRLACEARAKAMERGLAEAFVEEYAGDPQTQKCFFPVGGLETDFEVDLFGIKLLPAADVEVPRQLVVLANLVEAHGADEMGCVAATEVSGTSGVHMAARAREAAEHALRLLRITLRAHREISDRDLRFKLGQVWWLDDGSHQWTMPDRLPTPLRLRNDLIELATAQPIASLRASSRTNIEEHARIALSWFEKAQLDDDPVSQMLYLFFALEAILGDRSEGLKGEKLALRRAILGHMTTGSFRNPARAYVLYDQVRSKAVHGGTPLPVTEKDVLLFSADIRDGINEFLEFARSRGHTRRGQVRDALDQDDARQKLAARLYRENPKLWASLKQDEDAGDE